MTAAADRHGNARSRSAPLGHIDDLCEIFRSRTLDHQPLVIMRSSRLQIAELGLEDHLDEAKADLLEQHRFAQTIMREAAARQPNASGVASRDEGHQIRRARARAGLDMRHLHHGIAEYRRVPGRFEPVEAYHRGVDAAVQGVGPHGFSSTGHGRSPRRPARRWRIAAHRADAPSSGNASSPDTPRRSRARTTGRPRRSR